MATFHERVQDYVGEFADVDALSIWLKEAVRKTLDLIPMPRAERYTTSADITGSGLSVTDKRIIDIRVAGRSARKVPPSLASDLAASSGSLYEATTRDPGYYIADQKVYTVPTTSAKCHYLPYPDLLYSSETTGLPEEMTEVIVLDTACRAKQRQIDDELADQEDELVWTAPTIPTVPTIASIATPADIDPATWSSTGIVGVDPYPVVVSLTANLALLTGYVDTYKDIELAQVKIQEIQTQLQEYVAKVNVYMEEQKQETAILADARKTDAQLQFQAAVENASILLKKYAEEMNGYSATVSAEATRYSQLREYLKQKVASMQMEYMVLKSRYDEALYFLTGVRIPQPEAKQ